ncbi:MAG TPA: replicative DNA helicase [Dehalococcoidia bacterium]|nr:replicative DNA helicase [Dehalococcoidia bacterium]
MVIEAGSARGGEKLPPHDNEAEEAVIASLLVDPEAIFKVAPRLKPEDFFREKNAWVYQACRALWDRSESINQITVAHELDRQGRLADVGGVAYLSRLVTDLPTSVGVENYAGIVQRDATYRKLISAAGQIAQIAYTGGADVGEALGQAESLIATVRSGESLRDFQHIRDLLAGYLEGLQSGTAAAASMARAVTSGYSDLDTMLAPGLKRGDLVIVAARPSLGKTSLVLNFARNAALKHNAVVGFFSVEMAADQLVQRMVAMEAGVDSTRLVLGTYSDREEAKIMQALGVLSDIPVYFDDAATLTVAEMRAKARRLQLERGLDLIIVDYMQLMSSGARNENRVQEVSYISRALKQLARDLDVPVIACSQLSRAAENRANNIPMLSDLRESGSIEQDADVVMFIYREEKYVSREQWEREHAGDEKRREYPAGITQLIVAKHRNGATGTIHLRFRDKLSRFEDFLMRDEQWEATRDDDEGSADWA